MIRIREAIIVDTRWNGGGWLHNDIAQLLSGTEYLRWTPRPLRQASRRYIAARSSTDALQAPHR